jgi:hypothetical protein
MASPIPFYLGSPTASLSVTSTSGQLTLPTTGGATVVLTNEGPNVAYIAIGSNPTATVPTSTFVTTATPVLNGSQASFTRDPVNDTKLAAICAGAGTATLRVSVGEGT